MTTPPPTSLAPLLITDSGAVRTLTLDRPKAFNSLDSTLKTALLEAAIAARSDSSVRAVVITGTGRAFCAGQDLKEHLARVMADDPALATTVTGFYNPMVELLANFGKPVIAAVNGMCAGAGTGLACACDVRVAARSAVFRTSFAGVALSADTGLSYTLPRLIGSGRATRMLLLDEPVTAEQALDIGLVDQVVDDEEFAPAVAELAARLAAGPTRAFAAITSGLRFAASSSLTEALAAEDAAQMACFAGSDHREALEAFVGKRAPRFTGS